MKVSKYIFAVQYKAYTNTLAHAYFILIDCTQKISIVLILPNVMKAG